MFKIKTKKVQKDLFFTYEEARQVVRKRLRKKSSIRMHRQPVYQGRLGNGEYKIVRA